MHCLVSVHLELRVLADAYEAVANSAKFVQPLCQIEEEMLFYP